MSSQKVQVPETDVPTQAVRRLSPAERAVDTSPPEAIDRGGQPDGPAPVALLRMAFEEVSSFLACLPSLVPLAEGAEFRSSIVRDLLLVEANRATTVAAAAALLLDPPRPPGPPASGIGLVDCSEVLARVREEIAPAARLKGIELAWPEPADAVLVRGEFGTLSTAWSSLLYAYLMVAAEDDRLTVSMTVPRVRPAVLFQIDLVRGRPGDGVRLAGDLLPAEGPRGLTVAGALMSAVQLSARQLGGRFAQEVRDHGLRGLFVIPVPL